MPKQSLICTKPMTYATRRLQAGDAFEAVTRDARVLKAIGKARDDYDAPVKEALPKSAPVPSDVPPAAPPPQAAYYYPPPNPPPVREHHELDPLDALRSELEALGVHVDRRWGELRLAQELGHARERQAAQEAAKAAEASPVAMTTESAPALMRSWHQSSEE